VTHRLLAAVILLRLVTAQDDPYEGLKKLDSITAPHLGRSLLLEAYQSEMKRSLRALEESKLDAVDRHLLRVAELSGPYNPDHSRLVVTIVLALRAEVRSEGAALVRAVADDLGKGRAADAKARIEEALKTPHLAVTHRAEIERLNAWRTAPPTPAAVEAEVARWYALMPPGYKSACAACSARGETDCASCQGGVVAQACRMCSGKGEGPCGLCTGKGTLAHSGFNGEIMLKLEKEVRIPFRKRRGRTTYKVYEPQHLYWSFKPCDGKGNFKLKTESKPLDPKIKPAAPTDEDLDCNDLFEQLKNFVFTGKAKVFMGENEASDAITVEQAKKLFADYEKCKDGRIPCDACEGKASGKCASCAGKGSRLGPCGECRGAGANLCAGCGTAPDSAWLKKLIPPELVPALKDGLAKHARALSDWHERRAQARARREEFRARLAEARKGLDPTARLTESALNIACTACQGKKPECPECWGSGRREYYPGTPMHGRYAAARKLEEQLAVLQTASLGVSSKEVEIYVDDVFFKRAFRLPEASEGKPPEPAPPAAPEPPKGKGGSGIGGRIEDLSKEHQESIKKADGLHEEGKVALDKAKKTEDNEVWRTESKKAIKLLWEAQAAYAGAQWELEEKGIDIPQALVDKIRVNLEALGLARKQSP